MDGLLFDSGRNLGRLRSLGLRQGGTTGTGEGESSWRVVVSPAAAGTRTALRWYLGVGGT